MAEPGAVGAGTSVAVVAVVVVTAVDAVDAGSVEHPVSGGRVCPSWMGSPGTAR